MIRPPLAAAAALLAGVAACAFSTHRRESGASPWQWSRRRADYIAQSQVWLGNDLASWRSRLRSIDLLGGPDDADRPEREETIHCQYAKASREDELLGATPKFLCARAGADPFKVKWGADNAEVFAEVVGTRLLWALGFGADAVYPVTVVCTGCADDPWEDAEAEPGHPSARFAPAIVERQLTGVTIQERERQGWTWAEFEQIDPARGGAPRAHTDALKLLAAVIQHRDSKADNQRLVCLRRDGEGEPVDCTAPVMMIDDLGSAFGGPQLAGLKTRKMDLETWTRQPVWRHPERCIADLTPERDADGGLRYPAIGEEGRRFLAALLVELTDADLRGLFEVARADRRGGVDGWVAAFKAKREAVVAPVPGDRGFRCPR